MGDTKFEGFELPDRNFTMVPNPVFEKFLRELKPAAFKVLLAILHACIYVNRDENLQPERMAPLSQKDLMDQTALSRNTLRSALDECIASGTVIILEPHDSNERLATLYGLKFKDRE